MTEVDENDSKLKIIIVGDGAVGKTCLLLTYIKKGYPTTYNPTVIDNYTAKVRIMGKRLDVDIWDTAGQEEFESIRKLSYDGSHVALVCYNTVGRASLENIISVWEPEVHRSCPDLPFILVGTKEDLKVQTPHLAVKDRDVKIVLKKLKLKEYDWVECSAISYDDPEKSKVDLAFKTAISRVIEDRLGESDSCCNCAIL